jgi:hypothetical protein
MINICIELLKGKETKLSCILYNFLHKSALNVGTNFEWMIWTQNILHECDFYIWVHKSTQTMKRGQLVLLHSSITLKFFNLFSCKNISILRNTAEFINIICKKVNPSGKKLYTIAMHIVHVLLNFVFACIYIISMLLRTT